MVHSNALTRRELAHFFGITIPALLKAQKNGHPKPDEEGLFDLDASCRWFATRQRNGKAKGKALEFLNAMDHTKPVGTSPELVARRGGTGIEHGVKRLRDAEMVLYCAWKISHEKKDPANHAHFRNWQEALGLLTKAEQGLLKFKKEIGALTETAKFKSELKRSIESAKSILMDLPGRVAPQCEGIPWHQVQKLLESEIRRALEKLAAK